MPKLYSCYYPSNDPFNLFDEVVKVEHVDQIKDDGVLLLHGGADISPSLYEEEPIRECGAGPNPSQRDRFELACTYKAIGLGIHIIGICRGAQLLCAVDGGTLIQHLINHHGGYHDILDVRTKEVIRSNSAHHQAQLPREHNEIIAVCNKPTMGIVGGGITKEFPHINEIVYYTKLKALGIQGHPEWLSAGNPFVEYCTELIKWYLL